MMWKTGRLTSAGTAGSSLNSLVARVDGRAGWSSALEVQDDRPSSVSARSGTGGGVRSRFDDLFVGLAQRRGFREYLTGLSAPQDRNKTITCLAGADSVAGAGIAGVQRLQFFLSESTWDAEQVNGQPTS